MRLLCGYLRCTCLPVLSLRMLLTFSSSTERNDRESPLLRLPAETRNQIYESALSNPTYEFGLEGRGRASNPNFEPHRLGLLRTCRRLYHDTRLLPFNLNEFQFDWSLTLRSFHDILTVAQRHAVRRVNFYFDFGFEDVTWLARHSLNGPQHIAFGHMWPGVRKVRVEHMRGDIVTKPEFEAWLHDGHGHKLKIDYEVF
jgi:hypothetical protein